LLNYKKSKNRYNFVLAKLKYMRLKFHEFTDSQWQILEKIIGDTKKGNIPFEQF
jgi:hypothetical protein